MALADQQKRFRPRSRRFAKDDGIESVRCRICRDRFRVISGRHLSKHDTDRETYIEEYRLTPDELIAKDFRAIQSSRRGYFPHGRRDWIVAIKKVYERDGNVFAKYLQEEHPHLYDQGVWIFGDWNKALLAAGFDPDRMRKQGLWDDKRIIKEIRTMRNRSLPLYARYALKNHAKLFSAARRQYGSWSTALIAAGINAKQASGKLHKSPLGVLRALRDTLERHSADDIPEVLKLQAEHYFGSLRNAIVALKKDRRLSRGWNKPKILNILSRMHRSKTGLAFAKARRNYPALVRAAENYFGSWGKALHAAGIDPNLYFVHHKWRNTGTEG
jgi:hypothetical protein